MDVKAKHFINNEWISGKGETFVSENPVNGDILWQGKMATASEVYQAVKAAEKAFPAWADLALEARIEYLKRFQEILKRHRSILTETLGKEIGKPLWEAETEIGAMINKIPLSITAYDERCKSTEEQLNVGVAKLKHKPHGVVAVFGPFNFPGHLPNGHIVPALLAGNTVVFKPSEYAPLMAEKMVECWEEAGLPKGVLNLIQGAGETGKTLAETPALRGLFFTGSYHVGHNLATQFGIKQGKILALEMGGNNPLVVHDIAEHDIDAAVYHTIHSAYITAGQRCSCARRLIVTHSKNSEKFIQKLIDVTQDLQAGPYWEKPEPFLGPVISKKAADHIKESYDKILQQGGEVLVALESDKKYPNILKPGLIDVTKNNKREDEEIFGPLLQLIRVDNFAAAITEANNTEYGLCAGILCNNIKDYEEFYKKVHAGIINWNRPITGSSSHLPFGGIGKSGNFRPAGFYSVDYCAYPVGCMEETELQLPSTLSPGIKL